MRFLVPILLFASLAWPRFASAQVVQGTLLDEQDGGPVAGALVALLDASGTVRAQVLSDGAGRYRVRAPGSGTWSLRVQRIGFRDVQEQGLELSVGQVVELAVWLHAEAITMAPLTAEAHRRCLVRPGQGEVSATLWEEARKALTASTLGEPGRYRYTISRFRRALDPRTLRVLTDSARASTEYVEGSPFTSAPARELLERGFVREGRDGPSYYAPDAGLLLSDDFLDAYCFHLADPDPAAALVGLSFQPADARGPPAVRGTLWLNPATFELRHLDYTYTRLPPIEGPVHRLGGRVELERLPDGTWIVRRWRIRMPVITERMVRTRTGTVPTRTLTGITEQGAEVLEVTDLAGEVLHAAVPADPERDAPDEVTTGAVLPQLVLRLRDAGSGRVVPDAIVTLPDLGRTALSDGSGRTRLTRVPAGRHRLQVTHIGFAPHDQEILVEPGIAALDVALVPAALRLDTLEVAARSARAEARLTRGVRLNVLTRSEIAPLVQQVSHVGQLATRFPGLMLRETVSDDGRITTGFCLESRRGTGIGTRAPCAALVLDDIPISDVSILLALPLDAIESVEYLNALEAGPRWGSLSTAGVLLVYTRGNGPYRQGRR
jgi:hypothetical protein